MNGLATHLRSQLGEYPGRGLAVFHGPNNEIHWAYFVTGRSAPSRARRFGLSNGSVVVESTKGSTSSDPLRHYVCATLVGDDGPLVVGNGEQVQYIASVLDAGGSPTDAVAHLQPEPDPPIFTPRIAVVVDATTATRVVVLQDPEGQVQRRVDDVTPHPGEAVVLHTYSGPVDSPAGSAPLIRLQLGERSTFTDALWSALDPSFRIVMCAGSHHTSVPTRWWPQDTQPARPTGDA